MHTLVAHSVQEVTHPLLSNILQEATHTLVEHPVQHHVAKTLVQQCGPSSLIACNALRAPY